jgi:hypothetical protein
MARERRSTPVTVCMTGGHGEWFVQDFGGEGLPESALVSLRPDSAVDVASHPLVAGSQAEALVALRGHGEALSLLPDARSWPLLPTALLDSDPTPLYGRPPDARLPGASR